MDSEGMTTPYQLSSKGPRRACDNCRQRKVKCNSARPCDMCLRLRLYCSYCHVPQRRGPKFRTLHRLASRYLTPSHSIADQASPFKYVNTVQGWNTQVLWGINAGQSYQSSASLDVANSQYGLLNSNNAIVSPFLQPQPQPTSRSQSLFYPSQSPRLSTDILSNHVNIYSKCLYPITPVICPKELIDNCQEPERLSPERYAFLAALCAATHLHVQLEEVLESCSPSSHISLSTLSGSEMLTEAMNARSNCKNICGQITAESLLTSFFLFVAYGNLDRQDQAWFHFSQAISMAFTLGLHQEASYVKFEKTEAEKCRRVFWLLFVVERAYALQQAKPVMLRNSIRKPSIIFTDEKDYMLQRGFLNLIDIFERLSVYLYDWMVIESLDGLISSVRRPSGHKNLRDIQEQKRHFRTPTPVESVMEIGNLDFTVTQHWLQVMIQKLSIHKLSQGGFNNALLPFHLPVLVGKVVMDILQGSIVLQSDRRRVFNMVPNQTQDHKPTDQTTREDINCLQLTSDQSLREDEFLLDLSNILARIRRKYHTPQP